MTEEEKTQVLFRDSARVTQVTRPVAGGFARPNPGGRRPNNVPPSPQPPPMAPSMSPSISPSKPVSTGPDNYRLFGDGLAMDGANLQLTGNPLLAAGSPLLDKMAQLNLQTETLDANGFRAWCVQHIDQFDQHCLRQQMGEETRHYARYALCTAIDELVNKTHWGAGVWSKQSLLSQYHGETGGGERFFQLLEFLQQRPAQNLALLELMYVCLGLGFEGKYSVDAQGFGQLQSLRDNLFYLIRNQKGEPERDLSPHWQRVTQRRNPLSRYLPLWVVASVMGAIMLATYSGFSYLLNERSTEIVSQLERH